MRVGGQASQHTGTEVDQDDAGNIAALVGEVAINVDSLVARPGRLVGALGIDASKSSWADEAHSRRTTPPRTWFRSGFRWPAWTWTTARAV